MPSAEDIYGSQYLNAADVGDSPKVGMITEIGPEQFRREGQRERTKLVMRTTAFRKQIVINATQGRKLIKAWGDNYNDWLSQIVTISTGETPMGLGIVLTPAKNGTAAPPAEQPPAGEGPQQ